MDTGIIWYRAHSSCSVSQPGSQREGVSGVDWWAGWIGTCIGLSTKPPKQHHLLAKPATGSHSGLLSVSSFLCSQWDTQQCGTWTVYCGVKWNFLRAAIDSLSNYLDNPTSRGTSSCPDWQTFGLSLQRKDRAHPSSLPESLRWRETLHSSHTFLKRALQVQNSVFLLRNGDAADPFSPDSHTAHRTGMREALDILAQ